jgi:hypothetical protein
MIKKRTSEELIDNAKCAVEDFKTAAYSLLDYIAMTESTIEKLTGEDYDHILDMVLHIIEELDDLAMDFSVTVRKLQLLHSKEPLE